MARDKIFTERLDLRITKEHAEILKKIAKKEKTTVCEAIRICIVDYWEKM